MRQQSPEFISAMFMLKRGQQLPVDLIQKLIGQGHDPLGMERRYGA